MLLLTTIFMASLTSSAGAPAASQTATSYHATCAKVGNYVAVQPGKKLAPRNLVDLPPANLYRAVYRTVGGCEAPVVVKYDVSRR